MMRIDEATQYIQRMINEFYLPGNDALVECLLATPVEQKSVWDSAISISTRQAEQFYTDIFHFWVRSFFCFVEDIQQESLFREVVPFIACRKILPQEFTHSYLTLLQQRVPSQAFLERQLYPETYVELQKRVFSNPYIVLDQPNIKSSVACSEEQFVAYFVVQGSKKLSPKAVS